MKGSRGGAGSAALAIVKRFYPGVEKVEDASRNVVLTVTKRDNSHATVKNHTNCAMAVAAQRELKSDGMIVSQQTAYVIKGTKAVRYKLPESVRKEIVVFDRGGQFGEGQYQLTKPNKSNELGARPKRGTTGSHKETGEGHKRFTHITGDIREDLRTSHANPRRKRDRQ